MPQASHPLPINHPLAGDQSGSQTSNPMLLASAFSEFISASARLETSYRHLQQEVYELRQQLSARNAALTTSIAENERMRLDLQQILNSMPCGVLVLDDQGNISMINPESGRLLGLNALQLRSAPKSNVRQISALSGINLNQIASSQDTTQEFCVTHAAGKRWLEARNRPLFQQTILILRDITAQRRAEREREQARTAMALAEVTTTLAHEVRNPLASLELFAELIENDQAHRSQWISHLRVGIRTLSGTVNNVLSFHGSGFLKLTPVSLSEAINGAIHFLGPLADQSAVSLHWTPDQHRARVMGNESALRQVVLNLISNAIRHTSAGGAVTVAWRREDSSAGEEQDVTVDFSDTGCGLRPDQIDYIFEPGFSGTGDTSGLGLAVCARIVKQHGGRIAAANLAQGGAHFALTLPLLPEEAGTL